MGAIPLKIADLILDVENPRNPKAHSQREALQRILHDQREKLLVLAQSIVAEGMNPMERFLVMSNADGSYVVLEGNRRVAALKFISTPSLLDDMELPQNLRKGFTKLAREFKPSDVEPLDCYEVDDRESGKGWIHLRHTGANGGKGVVDWSGMAASRFRGQSPALQALNLVSQYGGLTDEQHTLLSRFPITTLERLLSSREVRKRLGFDVKEGKLVSGLPPGELMKGLRRMVTDLANGEVNVSALKNKSQQIDYIESFDAGSRPDLVKAGAIRTVEDISSVDFARAKAGSTKQKKSARSDPSKRRTLVPRGFQLGIDDNRVADIFGELRKLRVDDAPNAVSVLFRVFLELSVDHYLDESKISLKSKDPKSGKSYDKNLKAKTREAVDQLVKNGANAKDYDGVVRGLNVPESPIHMDLLNNYVHNRFVTPKPRELMAAWNEAQRFFQGLWS